MKLLTSPDFSVIMIVNAPNLNLEYGQGNCIVMATRLAPFQAAKLVQCSEIEQSTC